jgi:hypothetical protein
MTIDEIREYLDSNKIPYRGKKDQILITSKKEVGLRGVKTLPSGLEFRNGGNVYLHDVEEISKGVEFNNLWDVYLPKIFGVYLNRWQGNIEGINSKTLLNHMIKKGLLER